MVLVVESQGSASDWSKVEVVLGKNSPRMPLKSRVMGRSSVSFQEGWTILSPKDNVEDRFQIMAEEVSLVSL